MTAPLIERLGWTLVHSVWQLAALALLLMVWLRLLQRASPRARYASAALTLLAMAASVPLTFRALPANGLSNTTTLEAPANRVAATGAARSSSPVATPATRHDVAGGAAADRSATQIATIASRWLAWRGRLRDLLAPWLGSLVGLWLGGILLLSLRPLAGWRAVRRMRTSGTSPASPDLVALVHGTARRLGVLRSVQVVQSTLVQVPGVVGWLKPLILLPCGVAHGLTPAQLEGVLAHELAHVCRHDYLVNLLQTLAETLLFYHPAVWWVSHQMRLEREDCCDDLALAVCDRGQFARALLALAELRGGLPAPAMAASGGSLLARIRRIVQGAPLGDARASGAAPAACLVMIIVLLVLASYPAAPPVQAEGPATSEAEPARRKPRPQRRAKEASPAKDSATEEPATPWVRGVAAADPWFWPDPYPHLGHDESLGEGWEYLRIALDDRTGVDLQTTPLQRKALLEIYRDFEGRQRELGQRLAAEGIDTPTRLARRRELWLEARQIAKGRLTDAQHRRIEQFMIQRKSYNAFRSADLVARLELTDEQHQKVLASIDAHLKRVAEEERELGRSTQQAAQRRGDEPLAEHLRALTAAKTHRGRLSHRRVWDEIGQILSQQQREQFNRLRGPMPEAVAKVLPLFDPARAQP